MFAPNRVVNVLTREDADVVSESEDLAIEQRFPGGG